MSIDPVKTKQYLKTFNFKTLFRDILGWDNFRAPLPVQVEGVTYVLQGVAEKRGVAAFLLETGQALPGYGLRRKIERQVALRHREHLIIFTDGKTQQIWQWVRQEAGSPLRSREHHYTVGWSGDALIPKLDALAFSLADEDTLTLGGVLKRMGKAFDVEKVTKRFYERFKREHVAFGKFLKGVPKGEMADWYVSVMLNRLMFIYFIQKKGFLAGDLNYLANQLAASEVRGPDRYYCDFLCPLFFEGFATPLPARKPETRRLLGDVPYLNGGIFAPHQIEQAYGQAIEIGDAAFSQLFTFFDQYQWHLDDRPLHDDDEINPDVLGYIFEQYINQKQMGAYYTKEDITEYIGKNTIVPYLLEEARRSEPTYFQPEGPVWSLLRKDPDRYIYAAMAKGADKELPPEIAAGIGDVRQRGSWNRPADEEYALPTEIWRETVARRQRRAEVRAKLAAGEVRSTEELITYNLDLRQLAQDVIETCEEPRLLRVLWKAIRGVSTLDPTCGSGAFLFAALNILEPLYEACLQQMAEFVAAEDAAHPGGHARYEDFRKVLKEVERHPNQRYFITKSIIVDNLYGVDIMHEAVEIAKLRLFLKLVSLVEDKSQIEPLPDIDFNIRAGNTLVGFATYDEMERAVQGDRLLLLPEDEELVADIRDRARDAAQLFTRFRQMQTEYDPREYGDDYTVTKQKLRQRLKIVAGKLDRLLAQQYGVDPDAFAFEQWRNAHEPFHWFTEFYQIMEAGGFDVIIGNPPWSEYATVRKAYQVRNFETEKAGNLYGMSIERSLSLRSDAGYLSFIVQLPLASAARMVTVRTLLQRKSSYLQVIPFDDRPGKLFELLEHSRSVVLISKAGKNANTRLVTARYQRWYSQARSTLFQQIVLTETISGIIHPLIFPKYGSSLLQSAFKKVKDCGTSGIELLLSKRQSPHFIFYQEATQYWTKASVKLPYYAKNGNVSAPAHGRYLYFHTAEAANAVCALLNSSLFYTYFIAYGDCFHLSQTLVTNFPVVPGLGEDGKLIALNKALMADLEKKAGISTIITKAGDTITYATFYGSRSKHLIDEIDRVLAQHYGFTAEELDFITNYDIKYRLGDVGLEDDNDEEQEE